MFVLGIYVFVTLVVSFLCSLTEAALLSVGRIRIHALAEHSASARLVAQMKDNLERPIAVILILNTLANTGGATLAGRQFAAVHDGRHAALFSVAMTLAVLSFSELVPKTLGVRYALPISILVARPMHLAIKLFRPATWLLERFTRFLAQGAPASVSVDDLRAAARIAVASKVIGRAELMIIEAAAELPRLTVADLMIHREDVVFLALGEDEETLLRKARQSMHTRLLLCHHDLEDVVGVVNVKEVLWRLVQDEDEVEEERLKRVLGESVRNIFYVHPTLEVPKLLRLFAKEHAHLAVVRDGHDAVVGIVTLEDVVEELIGEVDDEHDKSPAQAEKIGAHRWRFGGGTPWLEAAQKLGVKGEEFMPEALELDLDGRFDMHDLAAHRLPGNLRTGAVFSMGRWRFKVGRMRRGKVLQVEALLLGASDRAPQPTPKGVATKER